MGNGMSNFTDFISGGGDAAPIPTTQFVIGQSKTFTAPLTGRIKVIITGGGGQGAFLANKNASIDQNQGDATGGGGGGYSEKTFNVTAGETFTITIGAGGASTLAPNNINSSRVGNNGGNTSFVTASAAVSVNMVANGGGGGQFSASTSSAVSTAGGAGGTASGGDFNYTGGTGGTISRVAGCPNNAVTTGGGAVALYGTAFNGGSVTMTGAVGGQDKIIATGGAGVGGNGGDVLGVTSTGAYAYLSLGGSSAKDAPAAEPIAPTSTKMITGTSGGPNTSPTISTIDAQGNGGYAYHTHNTGVYSGNGGFGGGSGASSGYNPSGNTGHYYQSATGGGFGGGGALTWISGVDTTSTGQVGTGNGGVGGGGSGAFSGPFHTATSATARVWGPGGDGVCIIMFV